MWGVDTVIGPAIRGELVIEQRKTGWRGRIAGRISESGFRADSIILQFPEGEFRANLSNTRAMHGFWIQPRTRSGLPAYSTPVSLRKDELGRWRGTVEPLEERLSLYLDVRTDTSHAVVAMERNPDGNVGDALFDVATDGDNITLRDRRDSTNVWHGGFRKGALILSVPAFGSVSLSRRDRSTAPGFFPRKEGTYRYHVPPTRKDGLLVSSPEKAGMDTARLFALVRYILESDGRKSRQPLVHSLLVAHRGRLVLEEYFHGFDAKTPHDLRSASKTFASILAGIIGLPPSSPVYASFARYRDFANPDPRKSRVTLAHLLTMTSGLACDDNDPASPGAEGAMQSQTQQPDWYKYFLDLPLTHTPGDTAAYCSGGINLAGGMISARAGQWLPALMDDRLMRPLGITRYHVNLQPTGEAYMGGGVYMTSRDLLKIGQLYLSRGSWDGKQIVPAAWVDESTHPHPEINRETRDAYMWHTNVIRVGGRDYSEIEANGNGGQLLMLVRELDLAVVITAGNYNSYGVWHRFRDEWLRDYIIPATELGS